LYYVKKNTHVKETPHAEEKGKEEVPSALERTKWDFIYANHFRSNCKH